MTMSNNSKQVNEYRCTRNQPYQHECFGKNDLGARQGYYINATSEEEALKVMAAEHPADTAGFTAELWKENVR
jgi:hypothetical protein